MRVTVMLFAGARELAGRSEIEVDLEAAATIGMLRSALMEDYPALKPLLPHALFAVDRNYATDATVLPSGAEIAFIPPVSGG